MQGCLKETFRRREGNCRRQKRFNPSCGEDKIIRKGNYSPQKAHKFKDSGSFNFLILTMIYSHE